MTTIWFPTPVSEGRGRLRGAAITGLTIDTPRRVRRAGQTPAPAQNTVRRQLPPRPAQRRPDAAR